MKHRFLSKLGCFDPIRTPQIRFDKDLVVKQHVFADKDLKRRVRTTSTLALYADLTQPSPAVQAFLSRIKTHSTPTVAVYNPEDPAAPIVFEGIVSAQQIIKAIRLDPNHAGQSIVDSHVTHRNGTAQ